MRSFSDRSRPRFFSSNWVITLTATLIGVFMALWLNEWLANRKLSDQKSIGIENVLAEMVNNKEALEQAIEKHRMMLETISFIEDNVSEEEEFIVHKDSMQAFKERNPGIVKVSDSIQIDSNTYQYRADVQIDFSLPQIEMSTIAWETLLNSGIGSSYSFDCLLYLGTVYKVFHEVKDRNKDLYQYFLGDKEPGEKSVDMLRDLDLLIKYEETTIDLLKQADKELEKCR